MCVVPHPWQCCSVLCLQEEFENGFGSHTPMYSGQTKCVRYYMNFERAMALAKECLLEVRTLGRI